MESHINGASMRAIARKENVNRKTVGKIIASPEMREFEQGLVIEHRSRLYGLVAEAVDTVQHALRKKKDSRVALCILDRLGVIPSAGERALVSDQPPQSMISPSLLALAAAIKERAELFHMELPGPIQEALNHNEPLDEEC